MLLADPGTTPSGEQLSSGDVLCKDDVGTAAGAIDAGQLTGAIVCSVAHALRQNLLELQSTSTGRVILADQAGKVAVLGVSGEDVPNSTVAADLAAIAGNAGSPQAIPATVSGDYTVSGFATANNSVTITGNLILNHGIVFVNGDLTVGGTITGNGAVLVAGNIAAAGATFSTDDLYGLMAVGQLNLP